MKFLLIYFLTSDILTSLALGDKIESNRFKIHVNVTVSGDTFPARVQGVTRRAQCASRCLADDRCLGFVHGVHCDTLLKVEIDGLIEADWLISKVYLKEPVGEGDEQSGPLDCAVMPGDDPDAYCVLTMDLGTIIEGNALLVPNGAKVGSGALTCSNQYAIFGPYEKLCITSLRECTTGFTIAFWVRKSCDSGSVLSTADTERSDGIMAACGDGYFTYFMVTQHKTGFKMEPVAGHQWLHVAMTSGSDLGNLDVYHNGNPASPAMVLGTGAPEVSTQRKIVFGRQTITTEEDYGNAWFDDVRIYNRELDSDAVMEVYNSYA